MPNSPVPLMNLIGRVIMAFMPITPKALVRFFSRRYVAGTELHHAIKVMEDMADEKTSFTVDVLGEDITSIEGGLSGIPKTLPNNHANWTQALLFLAILWRGSKYKQVASGSGYSVFVDAGGTLLMCGKQNPVFYGFGFGGTINKSIPVMWHTVEKKSDRKTQFRVGFSHGQGRRPPLAATARAVAASRRMVVAPLQRLVLHPTPLHHPPRRRPVRPLRRCRRGHVAAAAGARVRLDRARVEP